MSYLIKYENEGEKAINIKANTFGEAIGQFQRMMTGVIVSVTRLPFYLEAERHAKVMAQIECASDIFADSLTEVDGHYELIATALHQLECSKFATDDRKAYIERNVLDDMTKLLAGVIEYIGSPEVDLGEVE